MTKNKMKVVNIHTDKYDIYIGRGDKWGNPFIIGRDGDRATVIKKYKDWITNNPELLKDIHTLKGKTLGCYCAPKPCHGDVLIEIIKEQSSNT